MKKNIFRKETRIDSLALMMIFEKNYFFNCPSCTRVFPIAGYWTFCCRLQMAVLAADGYCRYPQVASYWMSYRWLFTANAGCRTFYRGHSWLSLAVELSIAGCRTFSRQPFVAIAGDWTFYRWPFVAITGDWTFYRRPFVAIAGGWTFHRRPFVAIAGDWAFYRRPFVAIELFIAGHKGDKKILSPAIKAIENPTDGHKISLSPLWLIFTRVEGDKMLKFPSSWDSKLMREM